MPPFRMKLEEVDVGNSFLQNSLESWKAVAPFTLFGKLLSRRRHHMVYCRQCVISNCSGNKEHHPNQPDIVEHLCREILVVGEEAIRVVLA